MYVVNIGKTNLNLDDDIAEAQIDRLISALGCEPENMTEEEFYAKIEKMSNRKKNRFCFWRTFTPKKILKNSIAKMLPAAPAALL